MLFSFITEEKPCWGVYIHRADECCFIHHRREAPLGRLATISASGTILFAAQCPIVIDSRLE
jgi:hypothetical protein